MNIETNYATFRVRDECLSHGGGKRSLLLVSDFLQDEIKPAQLATALLHELDEKNETVNKLLVNN